jgi:hypothetical protein
VSWLAITETPFATLHISRRKDAEGLLLHMVDALAAALPRVV